MYVPLLIVLIIYINRGKMIASELEKEIESAKSNVKSNLILLYVYLLCSLSPLTFNSR